MDDYTFIVAKQLSLDYAMPLSHLLDDENHFSIYKKREGRRVFEEDDDIFLKIAVFNSKVIATGKKEAVEGVKGIIGERKGEWIFDDGNLSRISCFLSENGRKIKMLHPFFVKSGKTEVDSKGMEYKIIGKDEILSYKGNSDYGEAFAFDENAPDEIGVIILKDGKEAAAAGASSDSPLLWQIGVNTKDGYRNKGYGKTAVEILSNLVLDTGHLPFYGTAFSHISSLRLAISTSFKPMWIELLS